MEYQPKHTIRDYRKFQDDRDKLGNLVLQGMKTSGGTDVDWLIEHRGGFIVMENKSFSQNRISIPRGQMIAFETLHSRLNNGGKCYFHIFGFDTTMNFNNPESIIWHFDMVEWKNKKIPNEYDTQYNRHLIQRESMKPITIRGYRELIEKYWCEFEEEKISKKTNIKNVVNNVTKKEPTPRERKPRIRILDKLTGKYIILKELAQEKNSSAYEPWTKSNDEFLTNYWNDESNKKSDHEKIKELSKNLGRSIGGIRSRLKRIRLVEYRI